MWSWDREVLLGSSGELSLGSELEFESVVDAMVLDRMMSNA